MGNFTRNASDPSFNPSEVRKCVEKFVTTPPKTLQFGFLMILSQLVLITVSKDTICAVSGLTQKIIIFPDEFDKNIVL